jgi:hypothetical protein
MASSKLPPNRSIATLGSHPAGLIHTAPDGKRTLPQALLGQQHPSRNFDPQAPENQGLVDPSKMPLPANGLKMNDIQENH